MTTPRIRSDNVSPSASEKTFLSHEDGEATAKDACGSFSAFDGLLNTLEQDPITSAELAQGRRWLASRVMGDGPTLASLRLAVGLSQKQLGQVCGLEQPHVSRYESGKHEPSLSVAMALAAALRVDLDTLAQAWSRTREALEKRPSA